MSNLLELNGVSLNTGSTRQLFELLVTQQMFAGGIDYFRIPNPLDLKKPWIVQLLSTNQIQSGSNQVLAYLVTFPNAALKVFASLAGGIPNQSYTPSLSSTASQITVGSFASSGASASYFLLAIGN